jgi:hypothetical protein
MKERLFGKGRRGGVLLIAGAMLGAVVAGPGAVVAQKAMKNLTTTAADKRYIKKGETVAAGKTVETKIDKFTSTTFTPIATAKVNAPGVGWLYITGTLSAKDDSATAGDGKLQYRLAVNDTPLTTNAESYELYLPDGLTTRENGAITSVIKTTAKGEYKVYLQAQEATPGTGSTILGRNVSVMFVPKGKLPKATKKTKKPTQPTG